MSQNKSAAPFPCELQRSQQIQGAALPLQIASGCFAAHVHLFELCLAVLTNSRMGRAPSASLAHCTSKELKKEVCKRCNHHAQRAVGGNSSFLNSRITLPYTSFALALKTLARLPKLALSSPLAVSKGQF